MILALMDWQNSIALMNQYSKFRSCLQAQSSRARSHAYLSSYRFVLLLYVIIKKQNVLLNISFLYFFSFFSLVKNFTSYRKIPCICSLQLQFVFFISTLIILRRHVTLIRIDRVLDLSLLSLISFFTCKNKVSKLYNFSRGLHQRRL